MMKFSTFILTVCALLTLAFAAACAATPTSVPSATTAPASTSAPVPTNVPAATTASAPSGATAGIVTATPAPNDSSPAVAFTKINLNTATADQILTVPNAGNRMVREFQEYRPYTTILQFRREIGKYVDEATVAGYEQYVYVPVDVNQADADTLQQIPGVTADIAAQLIAARPYGTNQNFLAKLVTLTTTDNVALAENYLAQ